MRTELRQTPGRLFDFRENEGKELRLLFVKYDPAAEQKHSGASHRHGGLIEIYYCTEGKSTVTVSGKEIQVRRGEILIVPPDIEHGGAADIGKRNGWVLFVHRSVLPPSALLRISNDYLHLPCPDGGEVCRLFERLERDLHRFPSETHHDLAQGFVTKLFYVLTEEENLTEEADFPEILLSALRLIRDNPAEIRCVQDICDRLFISRARLHALFSNYFGQTPITYLSSRRMLAAREMILNGEKATIAAEKCGYTDYSSFYRNYKKRFGQSPTESKTISITDNIPQ